MRKPTRSRFSEQAASPLAKRPTRNPSPVLAVARKKPIKIGFQDNRLRHLRKNRLTPCGKMNHQTVLLGAIAVQRVDVSDAWLQNREEGVLMNLAPVLSQFSRRGVQAKEAYVVNDKNGLVCEGVVDVSDFLHQRTILFTTPRISTTPMAI